MLAFVPLPPWYSPTEPPACQLTLNVTKPRPFTHLAAKLFALALTREEQRSAVRFLWASFTRVKFPGTCVVCMGKTFWTVATAIPWRMRTTWRRCTGLYQAWPLGASYSQSNQLDTEQSTVHCVMLSVWSQWWCVSILSSCISILLYISGFQIVVRKRATFIWYASSFQRNIWRRNKRYTVHTFSGLMRNIKV